jgi:protein tyrosine phosphatase (PTP) superfamily phosphohydrolase (DUF442 family)
LLFDHLGAMIVPTKGACGMPYHWRPIKGDNPNPEAREKEVRDAVKEFGGEVCFVGCKEGTRKWHLLADVTNVKKEDLQKMEAKVRVEPGNPEVWLTPGELP